MYLCECVNEFVRVCLSLGITLTSNQEQILQWEVKSHKEALKINVLPKSAKEREKETKVRIAKTTLQSHEGKININFMFLMSLVG